MVLFVSRNEVFLSERSERNQRIAGAAFDERHAGGGAHRRLAPDPNYGGRPPGRLGISLRRAKIRPAVLLASAHWGLPRLKFAVSCVEMTPPALA